MGHTDFEILLHGVAITNSSILQLPRFKVRISMNDSEWEAKWFELVLLNLGGLSRCIRLKLFLPFLQWTKRSQDIVARQRISIYIV